MELRRPTADELRLLDFLGRAAGSALAADWMDDLLVEEMSDGGMGSLRLRLGGVDARDQRCCRTLATCRFSDADGIDVIATLYANEGGIPLELDSWKVDFSPLLGIPAALELLTEHDLTLPSGWRPS